MRWATPKNNTPNTLTTTNTPNNRPLEHLVSDMMCYWAYTDAYEISFSVVTSLFPLLWCTVTPDLLHLLSVCPVPKISLLSGSPSYWDCCNDGFLSPSGSVYQEEEEVSNICCWLKGTHCFKIQRELGRIQGTGESVRDGYLRTSLLGIRCVWMRQG